MKRFLTNIAAGFNVGSTLFETTKRANLLLAKSLSKSKTAFPASINAIKKITTKTRGWIEKLTKAKAAKYGAKGFATVTSALNMVVGFWDIFEGKKEMTENLHSYEIFWKAKQLARTIDEYRATSEKIRG